MQMTKKNRGNVALYVTIIILEAFSIFLAYSKFISFDAASLDSVFKLLSSWYSWFKLFSSWFTGLISFGLVLPNLDELVKYNTKQYSNNVENIPM